jgi:DNA end-binding protein Ku
MAAPVWKGYLSFGLVTFPVRLLPAARAEHVRFHMLHKKDLSRVKEVWYCAQEDKPIERSEIVKGYETGKDQFVVIDEEELKSIEPSTASSMEILRFVRESDVDPIFFESSYYVSPDEKASRPHALFLQALNQTKYCAIAKVSMHGREHIALIRSSADGLVLHTLYYSDELHKSNQSTAPLEKKASSQELDLAKTLIKHLAGRFDPNEFHDTYREAVERLVDQKRKGQKITVAAASRKAPVIDLMEALKMSLKSSGTESRASTKSRGSKDAPASGKAPRKRKIA